MQRTPLIRINIARTTKVSGLLRARSTIHIGNGFYETFLFAGAIALQITKLDRSKPRTQLLEKYIFCACSIYLSYS
jgi:hypothetical protein